MALPANKISSFDFMALMGQLVPPRKQFDVKMRPGVPGVQIMDLQKHGVPFTLRSLVDVDTFANGENLFKDYLENGVDAGFLSLVQSDYSIMDNGWLVKVLDCRMLDLRGARVIVGGLQYTSGGLLTCEWDLIGEEIEV